MHIKDHYKVLELAPSATLKDIKKAYRKLAQQYHPDKNDNPYAEANFEAIKEAYETLSNPVRKNQYLQERWYNRATGNNNTEQLITPVNILKQVLEFEKYTSSLDIYRMDGESLYEYMDELLSSETIRKLKHFDEKEVNLQIILTLLKPIKFLNYKRATQLSDKLYNLDSGSAKLEIDNTLQFIKQKENWEHSKWIIVLLITIAICLLIKFS